MQSFAGDMSTADEDVKRGLEEEGHFKFAGMLA